MLTVRMVSSLLRKGSRIPGTRLACCVPAGIPEEMNVGYTTPGWIRRPALHACQLREVMLVSGLIVFALTLSARFAEASPFVLHVKVLSGGGGRQGSGGDAGGPGMFPGAPLVVGGRSTGTGSAAANASESQVGTDTTSGSAVGSGGPLGGIPIGGSDSSVRFPNTSPFGSSGG